MGPPLMLATAFRGDERPYLECWCLAYRAMAEGLEAEGLWFYGGQEGEFAELLHHRAASMPLPVDVQWQPIPVLGHTDGIRKNNAGCVSHACVIYQLGKRNPEGRVFLQGSEVVVPPGGIQRLVAGLDAHPALGALSAAVPEVRSVDPPHIGTMAWRVEPRPEGAYTAPWHGPVAEGYVPELGDGIEVVDAVPFGALLTRLSAFEKVPLAATMFPGLGVDQEWSQHALYTADLPVAIDWGVWCGHIGDSFNPDDDDLRGRVTTSAPRKVGIA